MPTRRTFLIAGTAGAAALALAGWLRSTREAPLPPSHGTRPAFADTDAGAIVAAVAGVLLEGALPEDSAAGTASVRATVAAVGEAIAGLPPAAQDELGQLFALLGFAPARLALARVTSPWREASNDEIAAFLDRFRTSRFALLRSAYDALHQLVFGAWYGNPVSWAAIGYPGPPEIPR
jgi:hypothetical protein